MTPSPAGPHVVSFEWSWGTPCANGDPAWFVVSDLLIEHPDDVEALEVCAILMGSPGWFDPREPSCRVAQTGGDSLNIFVRDPAGNGAVAGAVVRGCAAGSGP